MENTCSFKGKQLLSFSSSLPYRNAGNTAALMFQETKALTSYVNFINNHCGQRKCISGLDPLGGPPVCSWNGNYCGNNDPELLKVSSVIQTGINHLHIILVRKLLVCFITFFNDISTNILVRQDVVFLKYSY